jgi:hypothetical protein
MRSRARSAGELVFIGDDRLIVLERASTTTKLCVVQLNRGRASDGEHLDMASRPSNNAAAR